MQVAVGGVNCFSGLYLLPSAGWVVDLVWFDISHDTDGSHHQLDAIRRILHGLYNSNVSRLGEGTGGTAGGGREQREVTCRRGEGEGQGEGMKTEMVDL